MKKWLILGIVSAFLAGTTTFASAVPMRRAASASSSHASDTADPSHYVGTLTAYVPHKMLKITMKDKEIREYDFEGGPMVVKIAPSVSVGTLVRVSLKTDWNGNQTLSVTPANQAG
jgi:hypothetical protein